MNTIPLLTPLNEAVTTIQPEADDEVDTGNPALRAPWGTATVAGTVKPALLLERLTTMLPADLDIVTVHPLLDPPTRPVGAQASEDKTGVDQSVKAAA
jgi:hypothetical protein